MHILQTRSNIHVGNLKFKANDEGYATFINTSDSKISLKAISKLLGINTNALIEALTTAVPTAAGRDELDVLLRSAVASGATVVLASHERDRALGLATRIVTIDGGGAT